MKLKIYQITNSSVESLTIYGDNESPYIVIKTKTIETVRYIESLLNMERHFFCENRKIFRCQYSISGNHITITGGDLMVAVNVIFISFPALEKLSSIIEAGITKAFDDYNNVIKRLDRNIGFSKFFNYVDNFFSNNDLSDSEEKKAFLKKND
jgi:hypothetical protein